MHNDSGQHFNKNVLIAVDASDNARRAVAYVGWMLGGRDGFHVTLVHVIPEPEADYFPDDAERKAWVDRHRRRMTAALEEYRGVLTSAGFPSDAVDIETPRRYCPSMAECILAEREKRTYGTIVVGRQGLSRKEEFLFGSISSKIVNHARDCSVWVVA